MFRKNAFKFLIVLLCALLIAPVVLVKNSVQASSTVVAPRSVEFVYNVTNETLKEAEDNTVSVTVDGVKVYENGEKLSLVDGEDANNTVKQKVSSVAYAKGVLTASFGANGNYVVVISDNAATPNTESFNLTVTTDKTALTKLSYKTDDASISAFQAKVTEATKNSEGESLKLGDTYTVPSFESVLNLGNLNYANISKTVYYAASGATYYSSASSTFELSTVGEYAMYATFTTDALIQGDDDSALNLTTKYLVEKGDGFYKVLSAGVQVYPSKQADSSYKYFTDEEFENEITDETVLSALTEELVIPVFKFTIAGSAPTVKSGSTYQEKGYIDYQYTSVKFTTKGNDITTVYELEYSANGIDGWAKAEEELTSSLAFTPTKKGFYRVTATVTDCEGNVAFDSTANIEVADKFVTVKFKTSFSDWLSVNTVPFIFLCISAAALIGLIVVIFIPNKEKEVEKAEELDK